MSALAATVQVYVPPSSRIRVPCWNSPFMMILFDDPPVRTASWISRSMGGAVDEGCDVGPVTVMLVELKVGVVTVACAVASDFDIALLIIDWHEKVRVVEV